MSSLWYNSYIMKLTPNGEHMGMNTKTIRVKEYRDYSSQGTPQERHMENVERGYTNTNTMTAAAVRYEIIEGKRYRVVTL
jgi:hypothetical protein